MKKIDQILDGVKDGDNAGPEEMLNRLMKMQVTSFDQFLDQEENSEENGIMAAYKLSGQAKIDGVCEFVETLVDNGAKFLIFAHHHDMLNALENFFQKKRVGVIRIDGKVPQEKRHERVQAF